jgi:two-component system NtrC family response regulator
MTETTVKERSSSVSSANASPAVLSESFQQMLKSAAILVVDDEPGMRNFLQRALKNRCALLEVAGSAEEAEALRLRYQFDLLLVDISLPGLSGLEWLKQLRGRGVRTHVIYMTAYADLNMAVEALRNGADDFVIKPFRTEQVFLAMQRALQKKQILRENSLLRLQLEHVSDDRAVVGESDEIKQTLELAHRVSATATTVLIEGETGTGKEVMARVIHAASKRTGAFVAINCGTISPDRFETELFGYVKGAFNGATESHDGLFALADKGTLFLDEISELSLVMQAKLLRALDEKIIRPVGSECEMSFNARVLASTNRDLSVMVEKGEFRQDLYFRLNVLPLRIPPLRDRVEDIPLLVQHFFDSLSAEMRVHPVELMHTDWERLRVYHWPGNVRELKNVVERTLLLGRLPPDSMSDNHAETHTQSGYPSSWAMDAVERAHIEQVLASFNNNKSAAARQLGVSRKTLERKQHIWNDADRLSQAD